MHICKHIIRVGYKPGTFQFELDLSLGHWLSGRYLWKNVDPALHRQTTGTRLLDQRLHDNAPK